MAKVKIGDLTVRQFFNHCCELTDGCDNCPFDDSDLCTFLAYHYQENQLDKEVDIHEAELAPLSYTVTLSRIEWTHVLTAISEIKHDARRSAFVRQKYGEIGRAIREQIEQPTKEKEK